MSAPTFETLSAELNQALAKRHNVPSKTRARCTLGRNKVMVLIEYPSKERDDIKTLAAQTLNWLEEFLRYQFDMTGLPIEIADLSATADEIVVQLYLKYSSASSPFTMRSFTWKLEDGFAALFGQSTFDRSTSFASFDHHTIEELDLTPNDLGTNAGATVFSANSATDLYADLSEGISQTERQSDETLMEFLMPGEAPMVFSSELDLPAIDLPVSSYSDSKKASDFFELDQEDSTLRATADLFDLMTSPDLEDIVTDEELADEELVDEAIFEADFSMEDSLVDDVLFVDESTKDRSVGDIDEAFLQPPTVETPADVELTEEKSVKDNLLFNELTVEPTGEASESEILSSEDSEDSEDIIGGELDLEASGSEESVFEKLAPEPASVDSTLESLEPTTEFEELAPKESEVEELKPSKLASEVIEEIVDPTSRRLGASNLPSESPLPISTTLETAEPVESTIEAPTLESTAHKAPALASTVEEPEAREFVLDDLIPEELASAEMAVKETLVEETTEEPSAERTHAEDLSAIASVEDNAKSETAYSEYDGGDWIPFEYDEAEALTTAQLGSDDSNEAYLENDSTTEAYIDDGYEAEDLEDAEGESHLHDDSTYSLERDRPQSSHQINKRVAAIDDEEVFRQRQQWSQRPRRNVWAFVGLFGVMAAGVLGFVLTRPCTIGRCDRLEIAKIESDEALAQLRLDDSASNIESAQQSLRQSIRQLEFIPLWSRYYNEAQATIPEYEQHLDALALFSQAQSTAYSAAVQSQSPPHPTSTWEEIASQWQEAINRLLSISDDSPVYELAQIKLVEYRANLSTIRLRARTESAAERSLRQAQQLATQATQQSEIASVEAQEAAVESWQSAVDSLRQIPQGTQAYVEAQEILPEYEQKLRDAQDRAEKERSASNQLLRLSG